MPHLSEQQQRRRTTLTGRPTPRPIIHPHLKKHAAVCVAPERRGTAAARCWPAGAPAVVALTVALTAVALAAVALTAAAFSFAAAVAALVLAAAAVSVASAADSLALRAVRMSLPTINFRERVSDAVTPRLLATPRKKKKPRIQP